MKQLFSIPVKASCTWGSTYTVDVLHQNGKESLHIRGVKQQQKGQERK
jgi:TorA maturation chaperone TorD